MTVSKKVLTLLVCTTVGAAALMFLGVVASSAEGAKCGCEHGSVTHMGSDGSECTALCLGKHAGMATSSATGDGSDASASAQFGGQAKAHASSGGIASSEAQPGHATSIASGSGSNSQVVISGGTGKAHAMSGGNATANSAANCEVIATASNNGTATNVCLASRSKAVGIADDGGNAEANASGPSCKATANASGDGSDAEAFCGNDRSKVTATATGGGVAVGSDNEPPQCMPNGGTAMVTSPAGNCP